MRCHEFEQQLQQTLDARLPVQLSTAQAAHATTCESCRQQAQGFQHLTALVRPARLTNLKPLLADRIVAEVISGRFADQDDAESESITTIPERTYDVAPRRLSGWMVALLSLSAVVLLGVGLIAVTKRGEAPNVPAVATRTLPQSPAPAVQPSAVAAASTPASATPTSPAGPEGSPIAIAKSWDYPIAISAWPKDFPEAVSKLEEVEEYAPGFRPIKASFTTAIDTLMQTWPVGKDSHMMPRPDTGFSPGVQPVSA